MRVQGWRRVNRQGSVEVDGPRLPAEIQGTAEHPMAIATSEMPLACVYACVSYHKRRWPLRGQGLSLNRNVAHHIAMAIFDMPLAPGFVYVSNNIKAVTVVGKKYLLYKLLPINCFMFAEFKLSTNKQVMKNKN